MEYWRERKMVGVGLGLGTPLRGGERVCEARNKTRRLQVGAYAEVAGSEDVKLKRQSRGKNMLPD
jgi:hypothetical protein